MAELLPTSVGVSLSPPTIQIHNLEAGRSTSDEEPDENLISFSHKMVAELIGSYIRIFIGCGAAFVNQRSNITLVGISLAWGLVVTSVAYTLRHISGAHFNPAVTIGYSIIRRFPWKHVPMYVGVQVLGSTLASMTLRLLFSGDHANLMLTLPNGPMSDLNVFVWEFIISFILMFAVCGVASDHRAMKELSGVVVGATMAFNVLIAGEITGASMNPARSIGPAIAAKNFHKLWIYIVAPVCGAVVGSTIYNFLQEPDLSQRKNTKAQS